MKALSHTKHHIFSPIFRIIITHSLKKCWVVLTQFWVKSGQTQTLG